MYKQICEQLVADVTNPAISNATAALMAVAQIKAIPVYTLTPPVGVKADVDQEPSTQEEASGISEAGETQLDLLPVEAHGDPAPTPVAKRNRNKKKT